jgi:hypothetical protein
MPRIEEVSEPYALPEDALCLSSQGWTRRLEEVQIGLDVGLSLDQALGLIETQNRGLLGPGLVCFALTGHSPAGLFEPSRPTGYVIFRPEFSDVG